VEVRTISIVGAVGTELAKVLNRVELIDGNDICDVYMISSDPYDTEAKKAPVMD
jgi:hypothetical protein